MEWSLTLLHRVLVSKTSQVTIRRTAAVNLSYKVIANDHPDPKDLPILVLHDLLCSKKHWSGIGKTIGTMIKKPLVLVDLRNHGDSPRTNTHNYMEMTEDILALMGKLSIKKAMLMGHGMGGSASMFTALTAPERVAGLLVIDISPISTSDQFILNYFKLLTALKNMNVKDRSLYKVKKTVKRQLKQKLSDDVMIREILYNLDEKPGKGIVWNYNLKTLIKDFSNIATFPKKHVKGKTYQGSTLFIGGQLSEYLPPDDLPGIREMFPQAVITYVPGCGHNVHLDNPRTFLEFIIAFVRTLSLPLPT